MSVADRLVLLIRSMHILVHAQGRVVQFGVLVVVDVKVE